MIARLGKYLLAKEAHAVFVAFICALLPLFYFPTGFLAVIIIGLVTLQKGPKAGFYILAWTALPSIALFFLHRAGVFDLLLLRFVLIWMLASLLYHYHSWSLLLEIIALVGVVLILLLHLFVSNVDAWWVEKLTAYMQGVVSNTHWKLSVSPSEFATRLAPIATGVTGFCFTMSLLIDLIVSRWWQAILVCPGEFGKEFIQIRTGYVAVVFATLLLVLVLFKVPVAMDAFPLALFPFFVAGLSLLHFWASKKKSLIYFLILIYVGLFLLPALIVSILALIALIDTRRDFRKKVI